MISKLEIDDVSQNISLLVAEAMQMKRMSRCVVSSLTRPAHLATALAVVVESSWNYFMPLLFLLLGASGFLWSADKFATQWLTS